MPVFKQALALSAAAILLSACGVNWFNRKPPPPCPAAAIVKDAARKIVYRDGAGRDITDVMFEASLPRVVVDCKYDDRGVEVTTAVTIVAARGPADHDRRASVRYFAAVLDPKNTVIGKREFESRLEFPINIDRGATTEELVQRIPVGKGVSAEDYTVVFGFQLSREELEANRTNRGPSLIAPPGAAPSIPRPGPAPEGERPGELIKRPNF